MAHALDRRLCLKTLACSLAVVSRARAEAVAGADTPASTGQRAEPAAGADTPASTGQRAEPAAGADAPASTGQSSDDFELVEQAFEREANLARHALFAVPHDASPRARSRLLILLHGFGSAESERRGIHAWVREAGALDAYRQLSRPPVLPSGGSPPTLSAARAQELDAELAEHPFQGFVLACPYTPRPYFRQGIVERYAAWLESTLLPAALRFTASGHSPAIGLAGVSMGGRMGLELLIARPRLLTAFSGLQIELSTSEVPRYADRVSRAFDENGVECALQIHTSTYDPYRRANELLARELTRRGVAVEFRVTPGSHNCVWLREVGSLETLWFQDRALQPSLPRRSDAMAAG